MPRKVFISFLGTTDYFPSMYYRGKKFCSGMEKYVQIAALQYVQSSGIWTENDIAYVLLTKLAEEKNWKDNGYIDRNDNPNVGLETTIKTKGFPFPCQPSETPCQFEENRAHNHEQHRGQDQRACRQHHLHRSFRHPLFECGTIRCARLRCSILEHARERGAQA